MRNVEIEIFHIAETCVNPKEVQRWLKFLGAENYAAMLEEIAEDEEGPTDPALLIALAAKRCYMSFEPGLNPNVTKVRSDLTDYLDNVLMSKHGSVCEHACHTFAIENVSRVFTGEMNRHRAGVGISEGSMRFIRYRDIPCWLPTSIRLDSDEIKLLDFYGNASGPVTNEEAITAGVYERLLLARKKNRTQQVFFRHYQQTEVNYVEMESIWRDELAPESKFAGKKHPSITTLRSKSAKSVRRSSKC